MQDPEKTNIVTRKVPFEFPEDIHPHWTPSAPEFAQMWNGFSLTMPYLEPFLIRTMREGMDKVAHPSTRADAAGFMAQEGQHYQMHQRFNSVLKQSYPDLQAIEDDMKRFYKALGRKSLARRLAYSAGFESMTLGVTRFLIGERRSLFAGADTRVVSFWLWHMVEETEHKTAAFDVYQEACGGYFTRAIGVFHGSWGVFYPGLRAAILMLKKDGMWQHWRTRWRLLKEVARFARFVGPYLLRSTLPGHDPRFEEDLEWVSEYQQRYPDGVTAEAPPLVDTNDPDIPVPEMRFKTAA
ncbi:metal-dependent hydrolase [Algiphilus sp.]|uniref:metal-dependent hydrolase n=1 Tax=Algiphilus sp. TaxID=1872431 RepID=UPI0032EED34B